MSIDALFGGQVWEAPSRLRCVTALSGDYNKMMLLSIPFDGGMTVKTEPDGTWLYDIHDFAVRLAKWRHLGSFTDVYGHPG